ncbi:hypothetical protein [Shewanella aestuarii]|uniref:Uncharacterized protein n=1 Tax=Shewanella aestuarii TaxID=1028752 RepID=A0A6G9QH95_9GAMM|nr:hypothetical protein [Shewanella aestuarii]QIR13924.1 hypothetical protein HBH39_04945 [Shewanella aestuarii]
MRSDENAENSEFEVNFYCQAIVASYRMKPYQWLARFGGFTYSGWIPAEHRHLKSDYKEILLDMRSKVKPVVNLGIKPEFRLNTAQHFS